MSRNPPPEQLLLTAYAAHRLAETAVLPVGTPEERAHARNEILLWTWRLRQAHEPFWDYDPRHGLRNFPFKGWSPEILQILSTLYMEFYTLYLGFIAICFHTSSDHPDHPIFAHWFRPATLSEGAGAASPPPGETWSNLGHSILIGHSQMQFTAHHLPPWGLGGEDRIPCFTGELADGICSPFENRSAMEEINDDSDELARLVLEELYPALFPPYSAIHTPRNSDGNPTATQSRLRLDDIACAAFLALKKEGKSPTRREIAGRIKCNRGSLYRLPSLRKLIESDRAEAAECKRGLPRGRRDKGTGRLEAWKAKEKDYEEEN